MQEPDTIRAWNALACNGRANGTERGYISMHLEHVAGCAAHGTATKRKEKKTKKKIEKEKREGEIFLQEGRRNS